MRAALDHGINFFDTADVYGGRHSEEILGRALAGRDRASVVIATKFGNPMGDGPSMRGASREYIINAVEASLRRLNTDYIDLYQQHVPDPDTPIEETLRALDDLTTSGKVRYTGNSNFSGWLIADADWTARDVGLHRFVTAQNNYSLIDRRVEADVIPACEHYRIAMLPYFPLASGLLTGKYRRGLPPPEDSRLANFGARGERALSERNFDVVDRLTGFAVERGHTLLELAMSWLICQPSIPSVIAGATTPAQVAANADAVGWSLTPDELTEVNSLAVR